MKLEGRGLLSGADFDKGPSPIPATPEELRRLAEQRAEDSTDLERMIDAGTLHIQEAEQSAIEAEIDETLRHWLEGKYSGLIVRQEAKSPRTRQIYLQAFKKFMTACNELGVRFLPAKPGVVAAFLHWEIVGGASKEKIHRLSAAISWAHELGAPDAKDPTEDPLVKAVVLFANLRNRKDLNGKAVFVQEIDESIKQLKPIDAEH